MLEYLDKILEILNSCLNRVTCQCHYHLCSCCDISIDIIKQTPLGRSYTQYFEKQDE